MSEIKQFKVLDSFDVIFKPYLNNSAHLVISENGERFGTVIQARLEDETIIQSITMASQMDRELDFDEDFEQKL